MKSKNPFVGNELYVCNLIPFYMHRKGSGRIFTKPSTLLTIEQARNGVKGCSHMFTYTSVPFEFILQ